MVSKTIVVTINNFDAFNPRKDVKLFSWFRMNNDHFRRHEFADFTPNDHTVWLYLLCCASSHGARNDKSVSTNDNFVSTNDNSASVFCINVQMFCRETTMCATDLQLALKKLKSKQLLTFRSARARNVRVHKRNVRVHKLAATNERTNDTLRNERNGRNETFNNEHVTKRDEQDGQAFTEASSASVPMDSPSQSGEKELNAKTWEAYQEAFMVRYGVSPPRNAKVNSQIAQLVKRLGPNAPDVASFYLTHRGSNYIASQHSVGLLLANAEGLHTQWRIGRPILLSEAKEAELYQANTNARNQVLENLARKRENEQT